MTSNATKAIAAARGLSVRQVLKLHQQQGMPLTSVEDAKEWDMQQRWPGYVDAHRERALDEFARFLLDFYERDIGLRDARGRVLALKDFDSQGALARLLLRQWRYRAIRLHGVAIPAEKWPEPVRRLEARGRPSPVTGRNRMEGTLTETGE